VNVAAFARELAINPAATTPTETNNDWCQTHRPGNRFIMFLPNDCPVRARSH